MTSPRPSLASSTSVISTSGSEGDLEEDVVHNMYPVPVPAPAVPTSTKTEVTVNKVEVHKGSEVPGVLNGHMVNTNLNFFINQIDEDEPVDVKGLVKQAVKINSNTVKSFLPSDCNSANKLIGTKEDVEGLSRRWCYLITSLVILSLVTLLGTAVLSLASWRTSQSPPALTSATQEVQAGLSAEEKYFAAVAGAPPLVGRREWVAQPSKWRVDNTLPVRRVVVRATGTTPCQTPAECTETVRHSQMVDVEQQHQPDILDNFLIGGDGRVYWGRGFDARGNYSGHDDGAIGVAFVGAFVQDDPSSLMATTFLELVSAGVRAGRVAEDYALVACQVAPGASVGAGLLRAVKTWPHYNATGDSCAAS